jgi:hypothetical protein
MSARPAGERRRRASSHERGKAARQYFQLGNLAKGPIVAYDWLYVYWRRFSVTVSNVRFTRLGLKPPAAMAFPKGFRTEYQYGR